MTNFSDLEITRDKKRRERLVRERKAKALKVKASKKNFQTTKIKREIYQGAKQKNSSLDTFELELNRAQALFFYGPKRPISKS